MALAVAENRGAGRGGGGTIRTAHFIISGQFELLAFTEPR